MGGLDLDSDAGDGDDEDDDEEERARERMDDAVSKSWRLSMERMSRVCRDG